MATPNSKAAAASNMKVAQSSPSPLRRPLAPMQAGSERAWPPAPCVVEEPPSSCYGAAGARSPSPARGPGLWGSLRADGGDGSDGRDDSPAAVAAAAAAPSPRAGIELEASDSDEFYSVEGSPAPARSASPTASPAPPQPAAANCAQPACTPPAGALFAAAAAAPSYPSPSAVNAAPEAASPEGAATPSTLPLASPLDAGADATPLASGYIEQRAALACSPVAVAGQEPWSPTPSPAATIEVASVADGDASTPATIVDEIAAAAEAAVTPALTVEQDEATPSPPPAAMEAEAATPATEEAAAAAAVATPPPPAAAAAAPARPSLLDPYTPWLRTCTKPPRRALSATPGSDGGCGSSCARSELSLALSPSPSPMLLRPAGGTFDMISPPPSSPPQEQQQQQQQPEQPGADRLGSARSPVAATPIQPAASPDDAWQPAATTTRRRSPGARARVILESDSDDGDGGGFDSGGPEGRSSGASDNVDDDGGSSDNEEEEEEDAERPAASLASSESSGASSGAGGSGSDGDWSLPSSSPSPSSSSAASDAPPRGSKPAAAPEAAAAAQRRFLRQRQRLAAELYAEWNALVFDGRLPADLPLVWNPRLLTSAGRVVDDGSRDAEKAAPRRAGERIPCRLELSPKVLDTEARLRCTLAHEMCHVASWAISREFKEHHGADFKAWARRFEARAAGVRITTTHSYDIFRPHRWRCAKAGCGKVYGRHSKTIDAARHACGVCGGRLEYLGRFARDGRPAVTPAPIVGRGGGGSSISTSGIAAGGIGSAAKSARGGGGGGGAPNAFACFVSQRFAATKAALPRGTPHQRVMQELSEAWRREKAAAAAAAAATAMPAPAGAAPPGKQRAAASGAAFEGEVVAAGGLPATTAAAAETGDAADGGGDEGELLPLVRRLRL